MKSFKKYLVDSLHEQMTSGKAVSLGGKPINPEAKPNQQQHNEPIGGKPPAGCVSCNGIWQTLNGTRYYMEKRKPLGTWHFYYNGGWHTQPPA
mgnify:CR=1 FL=1